MTFMKLLKQTLLVISVCSITQVTKPVNALFYPPIGAALSGVGWYYAKTHKDTYDNILKQNPQDQTAQALHANYESKRKFAKTFFYVCSVITGLEVLTIAGGFFIFTKLILDTVSGR